MAQRSSHGLLNNSIDVEEAKTLANIGIEKGKVFASQK